MFYLVFFNGYFDWADGYMHTNSPQHIHCVVFQHKFNCLYLKRS